LLKAIWHLGYAHNNRGESKKALDRFQQGQRLADSLNIKSEKAEALYAIGDYYRLQHLIEPALLYMDKAEAVFREEGMTKEWCVDVPFTRAIIYKVGDTPEAMRQCITTYEDLFNSDCIHLMDSFLLAKSYNNIGGAYMVINEFDTAKGYLDKAIAIKKQLGKTMSLAYTYNEMASMYMKQNRNVECLHFAKKAYDIAKTGENVHLTYDILTNMSFGATGLGDCLDAITYMQMGNELRDSVQNKEVSESIAGLEVKFATAEKENELAQKELALSRQQNQFRNLLFGAILLLLLLGFIFFWYRNRLKQKELETRRLAELDELKTRYFTNISHELRTPLSLVIDPLRQLLEKQDHSNSAVLLQTANHHAQRIHRLVNQMLDLEKVQAGQLPLNASEGSVDQTIEELVNAFQPEASQQKVKLSYLNQAPAMQLYFNADKLEKILYNLLSNALKFTPAGGSIELLVAQQDEDLVIKVSDTGIGIASEKLPHIFDRFYQVDDSLTRSYDGTGIGLALAKELAELHHGQLAAESILGTGSTMTLRLPLGQQHLMPSEITSKTQEGFLMPASGKAIARVGAGIIAGPRHTEPGQSATTDSKPILLVIEDNHDLRSYLHNQ
ncbi:MAG: HAMP domain-containing sensor histidine kinase, partial [Bacteroidota bacterium]